MRGENLPLSRVNVEHLLCNKCFTNVMWEFLCLLRFSCGELCAQVTIVIAEYTVHSLVLQAFYFLSFASLPPTCINNP